MVVIDEIADDIDTLSPPVLWAQRKETLSLKVLVAEAESPKINMTENSFSLQVKGKGALGCNLYKFQLEFFKPIDVEGCVYKVTPSHLDVQLTKQGAGEWWPRLLPDNVKKPHFLKLDFDRWKSESDNEDNDLRSNEDIQLEQLKEALKADIADKNDSVEFAKNFYLFLFNSLQLTLFFAITMNCTLGFMIHPQTYQSKVYHSIGHWVVFAVALSFLEGVHAFMGMVKSNWIVSFVQSAGRAFALFSLWLGGDSVQQIPFVWGLYLAWSAADIIRYPVYMLQIINRDLRVFTWLRYHAWIVLYPLGGFCEYQIITEAATVLDEYDLYAYKIPNVPLTLRFSLFMKVYVVVLVIGIASLMRHMWKMRSRKFGRRRKFKPA